MRIQRTDAIVLVLIVLVAVLITADVGLYLRLRALETRADALTDALLTPAALPIGARAPAFVLEDLGGELIALESFRGRPVLLVFCSSTCPGCQSVFGAVADFERSHSDLEVMMISTGSQADLEQVTEQYGLVFPILLPGTTTFSDYSIPGTPFFYFLDSDGLVASAGFAHTVDDLQAMAEAVITEGQ